jgi:glucosylceramidase
VSPALLFWRGSIALLATGLVAACSGWIPSGNGALNASHGVVAVWATSSDRERKLTALPALPLVAAGPVQISEVVVDPSQQAQQVVGYGAAMTDASAQLFQTALTRPERNALLAELFGSSGLALNLVRVPIGASDFSISHYSLDDLPPGQADPNLAKFTMAGPEAAQIPALKAAKAANPALLLMASPWSAPGWMKDSGSMIKGRLRSEFYQAYASYFVRYLDAMASAGLPVAYVSVQNEPQFEPADYPGMRMAPAERARFIAGNLGPMLAARGQKTGILEWDHNWDHPEEPMSVLADSAAASLTVGVAWHCYAGDPGAMAVVHRAHPEKQIFLTECSGGDWAPDWGGTLGWMIDNLIIVPSRSGSSGTILWNLALDQDHGPHLGGCRNCRGVVTIDNRSHAVTRNVEYYVLGQVSRFVHPGARAIASIGGPAGLTHAAFRNSDGSLVLLAHNGSDTAKALSVRSGTSHFSTVMPAGEVVTFVWPNSPDPR